jgi:hypothetical protein
MEDSSGTIWLGGWEGYTDKWDRKSRRFTPRMSEGIYPPTPLHYNAILKDSRDRLLVGTNSGLLIFPDFSKMDNDERIPVERDQTRYFSGLYISTIIEDSFGDIWVGTNQGIRRFPPSIQCRSLLFYHSLFRYWSCGQLYKLNNGRQPKYHLGGYTKRFAPIHQIQ